MGKLPPEDYYGRTIKLLGQRGGPNLYRVTNLLANLYWVDFDLGCSTILPAAQPLLAKFPPAEAESGRQWNSQNPSQPIPGSPGDGSPCICNGRMRGAYLREAVSVLDVDEVVSAR